MTLNTQTSKLTTLALLAVLFLAASASAAFEDFSAAAWVKAEGSGCTIDKGTAATSIVSWDDLDRDGESYCYKDYDGVDDFTDVNQIFQILNSGYSSGGMACYYVLANTVDDIKGIADGGGDYCALYSYGANLYFKVVENGVEVDSDSNSMSMSLGNTLFCRLFRDGDDYTMTVRAGSHLGAKQMTFVHHTTENNAWRYLYTCNSYNSSQSGMHADGATKCLDLTGVYNPEAPENPGHVPTVYYVGKYGNDSYSVAQAQSIDTPWLTVNRALAAVTAGDTVYVRAGTYTDYAGPAYSYAAIFPTSGTDSNWITLAAYPPEACTGAYAGAKTAQLVLDGLHAANRAGLYVYPRSYIRIEGMEIKNYNVASIYLRDSADRMHTTVHHIQIRNCKLSGATLDSSIVHGRANVYLEPYGAAEDITVENCELWDSAGSCLWIGGSRWTVRGNYIHHIDKDLCDGLGDDSVVEWNVMHGVGSGTGQHSDGIDTDGPDRCTFRYNVMGDSTQEIYYAAGIGSLEEVNELNVYGNVFYVEEYGGSSPALFLAGDSSGRSRLGAIKHVYIWNNTFCSMRAAAVKIYLIPSLEDQIDDVQILNNVFCGYGWDISAGAQNVRADYNMYYGLNPMALDGAHSFRTYDPKFSGYVANTTHDVQLLAGSPAIGAGCPLLDTYVEIPSPVYDRSHRARPVSLAAWDLGAYEYFPPSPPPKYYIWRR